MTDYVALVVVSVFSGFGSAIGNYIATRHASKHMDALIGKVEKALQKIDSKKVFRSDDI